MDTNLSVSLLKNLIGQGGMSVIFALLVTKSKHLSKILTKEKATFLDTAIMILFFSSIGILGTYIGIPVHGAIANARVVGVFVGGLLGGPIVGIASGLIAGFHRWGIDIGGFTATACMLSTIAEGLIAAALHKEFSRARDKWLFAAFFVSVAELIQMGIILLVAKPFPNAVELVSIIAVPMIAGNAFGVGMFIAVAETLYKERERIASAQAQETLHIANQTLEIFRKGLTRESAQAAALIMMEHLDVAAVSFTSRTRILAHVGEGEDHHLPGEPLQTKITARVIATGTYAMANSPEQIGCDHDDCSLSAAVIAPLREGDAVVGTLKLYRKHRDSLTTLDSELALGLAGLFSTQLELSRLEEQRQLVDRAEMEALQNQINPHFLFNALNTIGSLIRTNPEQARRLLYSVSGFFRRNLSTREDVTLEKELEHVQSYLEIEKARFGDRLKTVFDIDPGTHATVPPLILQPIVENAVKHGLLPKVDGGTVTISARTKDKHVEIQVTDDGTGIPPSRLETLLSENSSSESVGLRNVHKRLIVHFGEGLRIKSTEGRGTTVTMNVPMIAKTAQGEEIDCAS